MSRTAEAWLQAASRSTVLTTQTALALTRVWHHASAQDRVLGNLASRIAWVLMGKHKPTYDPAGMYHPPQYPSAAR